VPLSIERLDTRQTERAVMLSPYTKRTISHSEARESAQRLVNSHFHQEPHARIGIPARIDYDDDCLIYAYIEQQERKDTMKTVAEIVHDYSNSYEFRSDDGDHTPEAHERVMLDDFGNGLIEALDEAGFRVVYKGDVGANGEQTTRTGPAGAEA
jgi:hypothetical protein